MNASIRKQHEFEIVLCLKRRTDTHVISASELRSFHAVVPKLVRRARKVHGGIGDTSSGDGLHQERTANHMRILDCKRVLVLREMHPKGRHHRLARGLRPVELGVPVRQEGVAEANGLSDRLSMLRSE